MIRVLLLRSSLKKNLRPPEVVILEPSSSVNFRFLSGKPKSCKSHWLSSPVVLSAKHRDQIPIRRKQGMLLVARRELPLGQQVHALLRESGQDAAQQHAVELGQPDLFDRVQAVALEEPVPSFLHSALCAMSLPVRRPTDETAPIIRQDGQYTLAITPRPVLQLIDGQQQMKVLGVPYGSLPRLVLIHIMTEAVRTRSRHIVLGSSFTDWMRRMGFRTVSYGPRGSATLIRQQLDRLLACEWMIRWDNQNDKGDQEFAVKEVKLTNEYIGTNGRNGGFSREILLTEGFFEHLREHAVPLDENAIRQLRDSATSLDLYTWLSYRLPRITKGRPTLLSWSQLAVHFGNEGNNIRKFRQTIRDAWDRQVSAVYPEAKAEFDTAAIRLYASPAPLQRRPIRLASITAIPIPVPAEAESSSPAADGFLDALRVAIGGTFAKLWLADASMELDEQALVIIAGSQFKADYIRQNFATEIERTAARCGLAAPPSIIGRKRTSR
jgi:hypothetical protein